RLRSLSRRESMSDSAVIQLPATIHATFWRKPASRRFSRDLIGALARAAAEALTFLVVATRQEPSLIVGLAHRLTPTLPSVSLLLAVHVHCVLRIKSARLLKECRQSSRAFSWTVFINNPSLIPLTPSSFPHREETSC